MRDEESTRSLARFVGTAERDERLHGQDRALFVQRASGARPSTVDADEHLFGIARQKLSQRGDLANLVANGSAALGGLVGIALRRAPTLTLGKLRELYHSDWVCRATDGALSTAGPPRVTFDSGFATTFAWYMERKWL